MDSYLMLLEQLKKLHRVKSHKETNGGLTAIRYGGFWHYYRYEPGKKQLILTGTTLKFEN